MVKLIALDLDGTLLDPAGRLDPAAPAAVAKARAAGIRVVLCTGRAIPEAADFARQAGCDDLAVALGGGAVADVKQNRVLRRFDLPEETGRKALALCQDRGMEWVIFAGEEILVDPVSLASLKTYYDSPAFYAHAVTTPDPLAYVTEHGLPVTKLHGEKGPFPLEELARLPGADLCRTNDHDFELLAHGVNKGRALALLALLYGVSMADCAAVGDSENDLSMLQAVGTPIAMGNAAPCVKAAAARVVSDCTHGGAAEAILSCLEG